MDADLRRRIEMNLFPEARRAVEPWDTFSWHRYADRPHSSQALAIDFFGTLKMACPAERDALLDRLSAHFGLPAGEDWEICLEWKDSKNRLNENLKAQSQIDAVARSSRTTILFECKFTERDGGRCSQTKSRKLKSGGEKPQCNGNYEMQVNPHNNNNIASRCALTGKDIRYWDFIPSVFNLEYTSDPRCPFAGSWYQWMRNLVLAEAIRSSEDRPAAFVIVYADHPNLPFTNTLASPEWKKFEDTIRKESVPMLRISYQQLVGMARDAVGRENTKWAELEAWLLEKICKAAERKPAFRHENELNKDSSDDKKIG